MTAHQIRHWGIQIVRRSVQVLVIVFLFALVYLSLYAHYRSAGAIEDFELMAGWRGKILTHIDKAVSYKENPEAFLDGFKGTLWSMRLAGVDVTDPLAALEMTFTSRTIYVPVLLSSLILVTGTLLLGRVFCSWICPAYLLLELTGKLRRLLRFAEINPAEVTFSKKNKYALLGVGLIIAAIVGRPLFSLIYPPALLSRLGHAWIFGTAMTGMLVLIGLIVAFELLVSPRWWCRTMCPGGALYALIGWVRPLRVKLDPKRCTACRKCADLCEPGLDPMLESDGIECDNCGVCIRHCPDRALSFALGLPSRRRPGGGVNRTVSRGLVVLIIAHLAALAHAVPTQAHHILGLPHYSYKENYPQVPTLEYPATTGPYDVLLTSYPGKPMPKEAANLAFYIKNSTTGEPYDTSVTVRVLKTFTFGRNREILRPTTFLPFDRLHKLSVTFPEDGEYIIELTMDVEGKPEVIPFMMVAGEPSATISVVIALCAGLAAFIIVVRAIRIKRDRRSRAAPAA